MPDALGAVHVYGPELGLRRIPVLLVLKVVNAEGEVGLIHGKTHRADAASHLGLRHFAETVQHLLRFFLSRSRFLSKRVRHIKRQLSRG